MKVKKSFNRLQGEVVGKEQLPPFKPDKSDILCIYTIKKSKHVNQINGALEN